MTLTDVQVIQNVKEALLKFSQPSPIMPLHHIAKTCMSCRPIFCIRIFILENFYLLVYMSVLSLIISLPFVQFSVVVLKQKL